jgi:hypothetical protein
MVRYKCPAFGTNQFSASEREADKPCIKCGHPGTKLQDDSPKNELYTIEKPFDWEELDGKTLLVKSKQTEDGCIVCGMDVNDPEKLYVLHWDLPKDEISAVAKEMESGGDI